MKAWWAGRRLTGRQGAELGTVMRTYRGSGSNRVAGALWSARWWGTAVTAVGA